MDLNLEQDIYPTLHADVVVELQRLFEHPRNALIHASPSGGYSKLVPGKAHPVPYRGITRVFDAYFFNTDHVFKNTGGKKPRIVLGDMAPPPPQAPGSVGQALRGRLRGTLVHHHLHDLLTLDELRFKRQWKNEPAHPWALSVVEELLRRGWRPLVGEFVVYDDALQLATAIDLIAVHRETGILGCFELKTGYAAPGEWTDATAPLMRGPMAQLFGRDTPEHRALLQCFVGALLLVNGHCQFQLPIACFALRVDDAGVNIHQLAPGFMTKYKSAMWAALEVARATPTVNAPNVTL